MFKNGADVPYTKTLHMENCCAVAWLMHPDSCFVQCNLCVWLELWGWFTQVQGSYCKTSSIPTWCKTYSQFMNESTRAHTNSMHGEKLAMPNRSLLYMFQEWARTSGNSCKHCVPQMPKMNAQPVAHHMSTLQTSHLKARSSLNPCALFAM